MLRNKIFFLNEEQMHDIHDWKPIAQPKTQSFMWIGIVSNFKTKSVLL